MSIEKTKCNVEWCENYSRSNGYCDRHYRQIKKHGYILENKNYKNRQLEKKCKVEGCNGVHQAKGYCDRHYTQIRRNGSITRIDYKEPYEVCSVDGCDNESNKGKYCPKHYTQLHRHGEILTLTKRDKNELFIYNNYTEMVIYDKNVNEICRVIIDTDKIDTVKGIKWHIDKHGYIAGYLDGKQIKLHRFVFGVEKGQKIDHINRDKLDNRLCNLRLVTSSESAINRGKQKNNTSGVVGVGWDKRREKWVARIGINNKQIILGYYDDFDKAVKIRREAEMKYHKEYSPNHNKEGQK